MSLENRTVLFRRNIFLVAAVAIHMFAHPANAVGTNDFIISYWCGPPVGAGDYDKQYADVAECNFTHAMFPNNGASTEQNKAILDACQKHGLKYIPLDGRLGERQPGDPKFAENLDAVVSDYAQHPALAGYFLTDEPAPDRFPQLAAINAHLLEKDPHRLPFINMLPNYVDENFIGSKYDDFIDKYCATVKPRLLCYDHYALFEGVEREGYFPNLETIRRSGLKYDIPIGFILQCTPHGTYRDPTETDLRWQVNTALAYGCRAILYFTYFTPTDPAANFHNGILDPAGKRTSHYEMAKTINGELKRLIPTLVHLKSTGVFHTAPIPKGSNALPADALMQSKGGDPLVVGFFQHDDGSQWAMIVNRDFHKNTQVDLRLQEEIVALDELSVKTGDIKPVPLAEDHTAKFLLPAGGMKLLRLNTR